MKQFILSVCLMMFLGGSVWGQTTVNYDFAAGGAVTGLNVAAPGISLDSNIGFGSFKNSGTADPTINTGQLRLYQNTTKGGSIKIYASNGVAITDVVVRASGSAGMGPAAYSVDGVGSTPLTISGGEYTITGISATSEVEFWCTGSSSTTRIYVDDFDVTYSGLVTPVVTIASASQVGTSSPEQNTDNVILSFFDITIADEAATLESLAFTTSGTYAAADIKTNGFKLWVDSDDTFTGATQIGSSVSSVSGTGETITFSSLNQEIAIGTAYFWITADIAADATVGNTISADAIANTGFTFTSADKSGSVTAGGTQTIAAASVPLVVVSESSLADFGNVVTGNSSGEATFTVSGDNLTDAVTVTAPTDFQVSTTSGSSFGSSVNLTQTSGDLDGEPVTVYVRFSPATADGAFSGNVTVVSDATEFTNENVSVSGNALDTEPTTQASAASVGNASFNTLDLTWNRGNGDAVLVVMKSGGAVDVDPSDAMNYSADAAFGSGTQIGTGNYIVYNGTGTSVTVTGLSSSTTYHIAIYEFNVGTGTSQNYNVTSASTANGATDGFDYTEDFVNFPESSTTYNTGTFTGQDGSTWNYVKTAGSSTAQINTPTPVLGRNQTPVAEVYSGTISGGISTLSFDYLQAFSTNVSLEVYVNDRLITTVTSSSQQSVTLSSGVLDVYEVGDFVIKFYNPSGGQVSIDNISWNSYSDGTQEITGTAGWRMLSAPIDGFTVEDISDNTAIQGIAAGINELSTPNFQIYTATGEWSEPTDVSTAFGNGYGFITYFYNNSVAGSSPLPITLDVNGTEPGSDVTVNLNTLTQHNSSYFTLVGNPFASNINTNSISATGGTIQANLQFWNNGTSAYVIQDRTSPFIAAPWSGFWVESTDGATSITIPTTAKTSTASTATYFAKQSVLTENSDIKFQLQSDYNIDEAIQIQFREAATMDWDLWDASKFTSLNQNYALAGFQFIRNNEKMLKSVESLPLNLDRIVELPMEVLLSGSAQEVKLSWNSLASYPENWTFTLNDSENEVELNLRESNEYSFSISNPISKSVSFQKSPLLKSVSSPRFKLVINPGVEVTSTESSISIPSEVTLSQNYPNPFNPSTTIGYSLPAQTQVRLSVFDMLGREVSVLVNGKVQSLGHYEVQLDASALSSGMYIYRLEAGSTVITKKLTLIK